MDFESMKLLEIQVEKSDDFLKIKETLTRIGVASYTQKKLYQSCHILHKKGRYYIVHFKELFALDGREHSPLEQDDIERRNVIAKLLVDWNLCKAVNFDVATLEVGNAFNRTKILKHSEKAGWTLESKHSLGKKPQG